VGTYHVNWVRRDVYCS